MSQVQIPSLDHCIWRAQINHLCKSGLDPIDCKSNLFLNLHIIYVDAMRLIRNIKKTPANEASMKMAHFSNIGVTEVFLEATPTMMITTVLFFLAIGSKEEGGLFTLLLGRSSWSVTLFTLGYEASILSSTFGVSRYNILTPRARHKKIEANVTDFVNHFQTHISQA